MRRRCSASILTPNESNLHKERLPLVSFQVAVTEELPFPDDYFDGVWMNEVFEHVANEERSLAELRRVLRPGGILVLLSPIDGFLLRAYDPNRQLCL